MSAANFLSKDGEHFGLLHNIFITWLNKIHVSNLEYTFELVN